MFYAEIEYRLSLFCKKLNISYNKEDVEFFNKQYSKYDYHNFNHISSMLEALEYYVPSKNRVEMELAVFFHDLFQRVEFPEKKSADYFLFWIYNKDLRINDKIDTNLIYDMILSTSHKTKCESDSLKFICDLDLFVLSSDEKEYDRYVENIRKEYSDISDAQFYRGRFEFLRSFLNKDQIYYIFTDREKTAINNLNREFDNIIKNKL